LEANTDITFDSRSVAEKAALFLCKKANGLAAVRLLYETALQLCLEEARIKGILAVATTNAKAGVNAHVGPKRDTRRDRKCVHNFTDGKTLESLFDLIEVRMAAAGPRTRSGGLTAT
jgi:hypothetical protein